MTQLQQSTIEYLLLDTIQSLIKLREAFNNGDSEDVLHYLQQFGQLGENLSSSTMKVLDSSGEIISVKETENGYQIERIYHDNA